MSKRTKIAREELKLSLSEIERLQRRVAELQEYIRVDESLAGKTPSAGKKRDATAKDKIGDAVASYLSDGSSMKTAEIVASLISNGIPIPGEKHEAYVSQLLSRDGRFMASRKHGWSSASAKIAKLAFGGNTS